jgi:phosphate transport system permease protein
LVIDQLSSGLITVVGLSVILAVAGMMLFLVFSSSPLFREESFRSEGTLKGLNLPDGSRAGEILFDEVAPIGIVLPSAASDGCLIQVRQLQRAGDTGGEPFNKQFVISKNLAAAGAADQLPLSLTEVTETAATRADEGQPQCSAQGDSLLLVRDGAALHSVRLQIVRTFLTSEELRTLSSDVRKTLTERRSVVVNGELLVKPSAQSPSAKLSLQHEGEWVIDDFFTTQPLVKLNEVSFVRRPSKKDGLIVIRPSESTQRALLFSFSENEITGEKTTSLREIGGEFSSKWLPMWLEGRFVLLPQSVSELKIFDAEDAQLTSATLTLPRELGTLTALSANFGGASVFAETNDGSTHRCSSLDAGRAGRLAFAATNLQAELPVLWADRCAPSQHISAHPHKRAVYRWISPASGSEKSAGETHPNSVLEVRELTTGRVAATAEVPAGSHTSAVIDPKGDLLAWSTAGGGALSVLYFDAPHLEVSMRSLFSKIRYESYEEASYSWQSTSGNDEFQSKFSLIPLIWGTIKATLYSLLFAVPLAIFAAVYSSEILDRQTRNVVKPTLEMMASVPSVVLGFLAAIVIAPWIENHIVSVLLIGVTMPFMLYAAGVFMQIPSARHLSTRGLYASRRLLMWVIVGFAAMIWLLTRAGLWIERTAFGGDLKAFLSGGAGTEGVLWGLLILPLVFIGLWSLPIRRARNWYRISVFLLGPAISVWLGSILSGHASLRDDLLGQYAQRNTLVISIAMGFAIIPIIYSLAEDALTSVPNSLRAGSLACGASVWQTTARVVLPTAASGLFSAVMVGLGRGIGETMIAVMATGNTAVMTMNPFDGLRSMAANIAVELPEAAQGSTHYRILFLSALVLFSFTFTLNSFAEFLRARYRARNKAL